MTTSKKYADRTNLSSGKRGRTVSDRHASGFLYSDENLTLANMQEKSRPWPLPLTNGPPEATKNACHSRDIC